MLMNNATTKPLSRRRFFSRIGVGAGGIAAVSLPALLPAQASAESGTPTDTDWLNVKAYGAYGDGVHDDTAFIQAAFNDVTAVGGGTVYFPSGQYLTTQSISVMNYGNGVAICGDGRSSRVMANFSGDIFHVGPGSGVLFRDLYIRCTVPGGGTAGSGINFTTGDHVRVINVWIYNAWYGMSCLNGGGWTEIIGSWIFGENIGLYTQNPMYIVMTGIAGNQIGMCADSVNGALSMMGCDLTGVASFVTRNSLGLAQPNHGITLINVGANYSSYSSTPPEGACGFNMDWCAGGLRLDNCYASGSGLTVGGNIPTQDVLVTGGDYGGASYGLPNAIHIKSGSGILIRGCQIQGASSEAYDGILIGAAVADFSIQCCNFSRPTNYCINSASTTGPASIANNIFTTWQAANGPVNYPATSRDQYVFSGNYPGPSSNSSSAWQILEGDVSTTSASLADAMGLGFSVLAGHTYELQWTLYWQNDTSGAGAGFAVNGPANGFLSVDTTLWVNTTSPDRNVDNAFDAARSGTAGAANTTYAADIKVIARFTSAGTVIPRYETLAGGAVTLKAGSVGVCRLIS